MAERPEGYRFTKSDEWVHIEGEIATIGLTDYAIDQLGDLAFIDLPEVGASLERGKPFGEVESTKAAAELFAPLSGEVLEVNGQITEAVQLVQESPFHEGWLLKIRVANAAEADALLAPAAYEEYLSTREH